MSLTLPCVLSEGLSTIYDSFNILHLMHHEATACHVTQVNIADRIQ